MRLYRQAHPARVMNLDPTDEEAAALRKELDVPLSRVRTSTALPRSCVATSNVGRRIPSGPRLQRSPPIDVMNFAFTDNTQEVWDDNAFRHHRCRLDTHPDCAVREPTMETC
jgi:hypothetical protein